MSGLWIGAMLEPSLRRLAVFCLALAATGCGEPATPEHRNALLGIWEPEDGSKRIIEFKTNGEFDYRYAATLRMHWNLFRLGQLELSSVDGSVRWKCYYTIEGNRLTIDRGGNDTCISPGVTPPTPMPLSFRRPAS